MGLYNYLSIPLTCPRCGVRAEFEAECFFGFRNLASLHVGDRYPWGVSGSDARPTSGDYDGEGYVECELCHRDFFIVVHVRSDIIIGADVDTSRPGYINSNATGNA